MPVASKKEGNSGQGMQWSGAVSGFEVGGSEGAFAHIEIEVSLSAC